MRSKNRHLEVQTETLKADYSFVCLSLLGWYIHSKKHFGILRHLNEMSKREKIRESRVLFTFSTCDTLISQETLFNGIFRILPRLMFFVRF